MFQKIYSIFSSNRFNSRILQFLIILALLFIILHVYNHNYSSKLEGFSQSDNYSLKEETLIYDDFYTQIYDDLMLPQTSSEYNVSKIIEMTEPSKQYSVFLDVGSGTGHTVNTLRKKGFQAHGIDQSKAMIGFSQTKFPDISVKCGNVENPITYDRGTFTHILCTEKTIYEFENKSIFFQNCYFWLQQNGYLIVHLVERNKFNPIIPSGNPTMLDNPQKYSENRITDTLIDFINFQYKSTYDFSKTDKVIHKETFTDTKTNVVRENEKTLYIEPIETVLLLANKYGFIVKGKANIYNKDGEYLYILERMM
jgi:SAM-dependent methyltransferase